MNKLYIISIILVTFLFTGCAGINPNSGSRTVEHNFAIGNFDKALKVLRRNAVNGEPWAQVRLGGLYEVGDVITQDYDLARLWYLRASIQMEDTKWAKGKEFFSFGSNGWYGENLYAYTAQAYLGEMLYKGKGISVDRVQAYLWINNAFTGLRKDTGQRIPAENQAVLEDLKRDLTKEDINQIKEQENNWSFSKSKLYLTYSNRL